MKKGPRPRTHRVIQGATQVSDTRLLAEFLLSVLVVDLSDLAGREAHSNQDGGTGVR